jgi:hypothetical protein
VQFCFGDFLKHGQEFEGVQNFGYLGTVRECLLSFGAESFVFQAAIQKLKDQDI